MSACGGKADITIAACLLSRSLLVVKQTSLVAAHMSANDPKRTSPLHCGMSAKADLRKVSYPFRASRPIATIACGHFSFSGSFFGTWPGTCNNLVVMFALGKGRKRFEHLEQPGLRCKASALDHAN